MNILISGVKSEVLAKIKKLVEEERESKEAKITEEMKETLTMNELKKVLKPIEKFLEDYYKMFPHRKPKEDRPFDWDETDNFNPNK